MTSVDGVRSRILEVVGEPGTPELVALYMDPEGPFAGATFDDLGTNPPNEVTIDDLLAVTLLDVQCKPLALRRILGEDREEISRRLSKIDPEACLWEPPSDLQEATELWRFLCKEGRYRGIGRVTAGKLLARKRPHLVPIVDRVIVATLAAPNGQYWDALRECLSHSEVRDAIESLRGPGSKDLSLLRLLDIAIWMRGSGSGTAKAARQKVGL